MVHVLATRLHDVHWLGHAPGTQYPLSHDRPLWQSLLVVQAKPSDRRVTRQLVVASAPSPRIARSAMTKDGFITTLPGS